MGGIDKFVGGVNMRETQIDIKNTNKTKKNRGRGGSRLLTVGVFTPPHTQGRCKNITRTQ